MFRCLSLWKQIPLFYVSCPWKRLHIFSLQVSISLFLETSAIYTLAFQKLLPNRLNFRWLCHLCRRHGSGDVLCPEGSGWSHWRWWSHCGRHLGPWGLLRRGDKLLHQSAVTSRSFSWLAFFVCLFFYFFKFKFTFAAKTSRAHIEGSRINFNFALHFWLELRYSVLQR